MQYVLTQNKQILLGPIFWRHRQIQSELDDQEVEFLIPPVEPNAYIEIDNEFEIFPVIGLEIPSHDPIYQQLAGPFWVFTDVAAGSYAVVDKQLNVIKNELTALAASERYKKEVAGTTMTIQESEVSVATDRESRNVFTQKLVTMSDTDTVQWKFHEGWLTLSKTELTTVLNAVNSYVQTQFDWENSIVGQIAAASTAEELKEIVIIEEPINGIE
jgi:hypothetical protein